jgi:hypothetical protein
VPPPPSGRVRPVVRVQEVEAAPASQSEPWFPCTGIPPASFNVLATYMRFQVDARHEDVGGEDLEGPGPFVAVVTVLGPGSTRDAVAVGVKRRATARSR